MSLIKVIVGSTRPSRFGIQPAEWIMQLAKELPETNFRLVDLQEVNLPLLNESQPAVYGQYEHEHSKAWAKEIDEADGFIIVTPEYNRGTSPALKNAIDYAAREWFYKPVAYVSYGAEAGGVRAVEQLHNTFTWLRAYNIHSVVSFPNYWNQLDENGKLVPSEAQTAAARRMLLNVSFWADALQTPRKELQERDRRDRDN